MRFQLPQRGILGLLFLACYAEPSFADLGRPAQARVIAGNVGWTTKNLSPSLHMQRPQASTLVEEEIRWADQAGKIRALTPQSTDCSLSQ